MYSKLGNNTCFYSYREIEIVYHMNSEYIIIIVYKITHKHCILSLIKTKSNDPVYSPLRMRYHIPYRSRRYGTRDLQPLDCGHHILYIPKSIFLIDLSFLLVVIYKSYSSVDHIRNYLVCNDMRNTLVLKTNT